MIAVWVLVGRACVQLVGWLAGFGGGAVRKLVKAVIRISICQYFLLLSYRLLLNTVFPKVARSQSRAARATAGDRIVRTWQSMAPPVDHDLAAVTTAELQDSNKVNSTPQKHQRL
ncbi:hypothetical protein CANCADRAFT_56433 [Tortispora caseinolytica NRRL Y-17796]|uniref:Uncharacterized protein n=1 Tax=Tortispora caseinolytica NRRL Y-17796 TaxID=767744 RepID=A0A1E4TMA7_9ASCO|nr:hypothetical protein CANCADRAFT_56433 [Tortispora caseinolytica NRRL Y-17796]